MKCALRARGISLTAHRSRRRTTLLPLVRLTMPKTYLQSIGRTAPASISASSYLFRATRRLPLCTTTRSLTFPKMTTVWTCSPTAPIPHSPAPPATSPSQAISSTVHLLVRADISSIGQPKSTGDIAVYHPPYLLNLTRCSSVYLCTLGLFLY